uniref:Uncharacterized protein n=1 Tax=Octopus bimaculoides TaxID=37653 RepID=A0A0L8G453_OCTBM
MHKCFALFLKCVALCYYISMLTHTYSNYESLSFLSILFYIFSFLSLHLFLTSVHLLVNDCIYIFCITHQVMHFQFHTHLYSSISLAFSLEAGWCGNSPITFRQDKEMPHHHHHHHPWSAYSSGSGE